MAVLMAVLGVVFSNMLEEADNDEDSHGADGMTPEERRDLFCESIRPPGM